MAGRFAPSPTGPLHMGSLASALASFLDARALGLPWWVRMEDLDPPREQAGAAALILQQLKDHGLCWDSWPEAPQDQGVLFQHQRHGAYAEAIAQLRAAGLAYPCTCSRRQLQDLVDEGRASRLPEGEIRYPGSCRPTSGTKGMQSDSGPTAAKPSRAESEASAGVSASISIAKPTPAWRFLSPGGEDDFILKRADGFWAYHLAVVVDDAHQQVSRIVRGADLESALPRHRWLQAALGLPKPEVLHVPIIRNARGEKLSKQTLAPALSGGDAVHGQLRAAWHHLETVMPRHWLDQVAACFLARF